MNRVLRCIGVGLVLVAGLALTLDAMAAPKRGGTLVIISSQVPRHFNPAVQSGTATAVPGTQIFATPLRYDENWNPQPYLARSWEVADNGKSVTLKLVENARFHDGKPITSEDVAFSVKTVQENHPFKSMFAAVETVETPDPHTAILRLSQSHPAILLAMSSALLPIIPKHIYGDGQEAKTHPRNADPVGSGPFKFVEYRRGEHIIPTKQPKPKESIDIENGSLKNSGDRATAAARIPQDPPTRMLQPTRRAGVATPRARRRMARKSVVS